MTSEDRSGKGLVLVTGCAGFIGHTLCRKLLDSGVRVIGLDELNAFYDLKIKQKRVRMSMEHPNFSFADNVRSVSVPFDEIDTVFHLAAQASVRYCELHPQEARQCNQELTQTLLQVISPSCHLIYVSSSSVYGKAPLPWSETTKPEPLGVYARSKLACEELVVRRGPPATIIRPFSVVGPGIRPDLAPSVFIDRVIHRDTVEIFGDGSARRDFTHVDVVATALIAAMQRRRRATDVRTYPIGSGQPRSIIDLVKAVEIATGRAARVAYSPAHPNEPVVTNADSRSAKKDLGFHPTETLHQAVKEIVLYPRSIKVIVVVATHKREHLLRTRALPSISAQTIPPNEVCVVVDDQTTQLDSLKKEFPEYRFIRNSRTQQRASGAWNCGVLELTSLPQVQNYCYLAILDDDDQWERDHLEKCLELVQNGLTDLVVSGIVRHDENGIRQQTIPSKLQKEDFFVGNPHIQGSNLFVSLRLFYRAGMFDEHLPSCTDRDLCIRLFDVASDINIQKTQNHTVHHFAESDRLRLSSSNSIQKQLGVYRFAYKHERRMTVSQREAFWERAKSLFSVSAYNALHAGPAGNTCFAVKRSEYRQQDPPVRTSLLQNAEVVCVLIGIISDKPHIATTLIHDISLCADKVTCRVLILANGFDPRHFEDLLRKHSVAGSVIYSESRLEIAEARTMIQLHCGMIWKRMISLDAVVIMDDDKRLSKEWFANLRFLLKSPGKPNGGFIGPDMGTPPLPAAFSARTSLIDLFYSNFGQVERLSDLVGDDLFYDLSEKNTHHLEYPVTCLGYSAEPMTSILKGIPMARNALQTHHATPSVLRGGCCVVLDPELLVDIPNPTVSIGGIVSRRSDMLWVQATKRIFVMHPGLAVQHDRTNDCVHDVGAFLLTAKKDLFGSALYRPAQERKSFLRSRLKQLGANILRIQGLEAALKQAPHLHYSYCNWVAEVIRPVTDNIDAVVVASMGTKPPHESFSVTDAFVMDFRLQTAKQLLLREQPSILNVKHLGSGSEGVVFRASRGSVMDMKFKILDCYCPRESTYSGVVPHHFRMPYSTIIESQYIPGGNYTGGHGPSIVRLLRKIQDDETVCYRNWKPANLVVNDGGIHMVDIGRDVVPYSKAEFESMVRRAYLSWRFPHHGEVLDRYCRDALTEHIPQLDMVGYFFEAINDRSPDKDLYRLVDDKLQSLSRDSSTIRILDFGSGKAKFKQYSGRSNIVNYDPFVLDHSDVLSCIDDVSGEYDVVLCMRVLCVLDDNEFEKALRDIRCRTQKQAGSVIFTLCDPRGVVVGDKAEECFLFQKTMPNGRQRPEYYRPLRVVKTALVRAGFEILDEFIFWRIDHDRFEKHPNQWCCLAKPAPHPRHTIMIKTCFMEHSTILQRVQHLVETLPCGLRTTLVLDGKKEHFQREYAEANQDVFFRQAAQLLREGWIDEMLEPPSEEDVRRIHVEWFGFRPDLSERSGTHDVSGMQYASTFHGFNNCDTDLVLQLDSDLMVFPGASTSSLPYGLFDDDPSALTWSLPIASHHPQPYTTGHRFEVRGCLVSLSRLRNVFRRSHEPLSVSIGRDHWHRIVDRNIGTYQSYRGGPQYPCFVHPPNELKRDTDRYLLAVDAVQNGRFHPDQFEQVDWVGFPTRGRGEPVVMVVCGRNVAPGRMRRCIDSIARNAASNTTDGGGDVGVVVVDDSSNRQSAVFLGAELRACTSLSASAVTFVSRRRRVGLQPNLSLGIRDLCDDPRSVICTVDLDDALLGQPIATIRQIYRADPGLEAAYGGCVHAHKPVRYEIDASRPVPPRDARGQPYFTHLRTFRKGLFDRILARDLFVNGGPSWLAADWAYSVPIWEQAGKVRALLGDLYLYEPDHSHDKATVEKEIAKVMACPPYARRRYMVAVVGDSNMEHPEAFAVGYHLAKAGYIVTTGGLGGVMLEASRGAQQARITPTVGILPGTDPSVANPFVDVPIATGMGQHRNGIVALAHAVVVVGGRAGTQSEVALAWSARRLVIGLTNVPGCGQTVAGKPLDLRRRYRDIPEDRVYGAASAEEVVALLDQWLPRYCKLRSRL